MKFSNSKRDRDFDLLVDYLDGELSALKQERLEARLEAEPELANRLRQLRAVHAEIGDLPNVPVPRNFTLGPEHIKHRRKVWSIWPILQLVSTGRGGMGVRWAGYPLIAIAGVLVLLSSVTLYQRTLYQRRSGIAAYEPPTLKLTQAYVSSDAFMERLLSTDNKIGLPQTAVAMVPIGAHLPTSTQKPMATHTPMALHLPTSTQGPQATSRPFALPATKPASIPTPTEWGGDACSMPDHSIHVTTNGSVLYNSSSDIAGFQFNVDGAIVLNASGGEAEAEDFSISASDTIVLGFSLAAATFDGCGTMVELSLDGEAIGLSGIIISDPDADALPFEYFDGVVPTTSATSTTTGLPICEETTVLGVGTRLNIVEAGGVSISFENGVFLTSYADVLVVQNQRPGDKVRVCLVEVPVDCPPGDDKRGWKYSVYDYNQNETYVMYNSQHTCGGA